MSPRRKLVLYYPKLVDDARAGAAATDVLPLSVLQLAGGPLQDGCEVVLVDGNLHAGEAAHRRVLEECEGALLLGITSILGFQVADGARCAERVRALHPRLRIVAGGWFPSAVPEPYLAGGLVDAVAHGQGELTLRELVAACESGVDWEAVPGLILRRDGALVRTAPRAVAGWEQLPACPWHLLDFEPYRAMQHTRRGARLVERVPRPPLVPAPRPYAGLSYFSSFGCPEPCAFCGSPGMTGQRWKAMPAARMLDEIEELHARWKFDLVRFHDANFGVHEERAREFAAGLLARGLRLPWMAFFQSWSILRYAPATLDLLAESGLYTAVIGGESGDARTLARIGKHGETGDNLRAARELEHRGVRQMMTYIIGFPNESEESMLSTLEEVRAIRAACAHAEPAVWPYRPVPGTRFFDEALALGYQPPRTLEQWGRTGEYHLDEGWPGKIPEHVAARRRLYQHWFTLSTARARGRIGFWEKRAQKRIETGDFRFARTEAKLFDLYFRVSRLWDARARAPRGTDWEQGDGAYRVRAE